MNTNQAKSIFSSLVFQGTAIAAISTVLTAVGPDLGTLLDKIQKKEQIQYSEVLNLVILTLGTIGGGTLAIAGRVRAKDDIYTPNWLPGPNKSDYEPQSDTPQGEEQSDYPPN